MSVRKIKRFWKEATVAPLDDGFTVLLDGRALQTPAKQPLVVPMDALAARIAAEWDAQEGEVDPMAMPFTRSANAAIDKVRVQHAEVADLIAAYGDADLLCYRAETPQELVARQQAGWDPLLEWARDDQGIDLRYFSGVIHQPQSTEALGRIAALTRAMNAYELTAFHDLVSLSGSYVLGLAAARRQQPATALWDLSRIDETWQEEQWGADEEATAMAAIKRTAFLHAADLFRIASQS